MRTELKDAEPKATDPNGVEWTMYAEPERDGDGFWATHYVAVSDRGDFKLLPFSRFMAYEARHFETLVKAGFPRRPGTVLCNWSPDELDALTH